MQKKQFFIYEYENSRCYISSEKLQQTASFLLLGKVVAVVAPRRPPVTLLFTTVITARQPFDLFCSRNPGLNRQQWSLQWEGPPPPPDLLICEKPGWV